MVTVEPSIFTPSSGDVAELPDSVTVSASPPEPAGEWTDLSAASTSVAFCTVPAAAAEDDEEEGEEEEQPASAAAARVAEKIAAFSRLPSLMVNSLPPGRNAGA